MTDNNENLLTEEQVCKECTAFTYQSATVSVPVSVKPKVTTGNIKTFCCGEPIISPSPYKIICSPRSGNCSFVLTQNICIEIPIEFSAEAYANCPTIECGEATGQTCEECGV